MKLNKYFVLLAMYSVVSTGDSSPFSEKDDYEVVRKVGSGKYSEVIRAFKSLK